MLYFSQLHLNPASRMVQRELANPYQLHRTLLNAFGTTREQAGMLHRVDVDNHGIRVLVQSAEKPDWQALNKVGQGRYLLRSPSSAKSADFTLPLNACYRFRLVASPTVAKKREGRKNSNRVPLVREEKQLDWLRRKGALHGFHVLQATASQSVRRHDKIHRDKETTHAVTIHTVRFDGQLQIIDAAKFNEAWHKGVGPAKAFGCGMISLASI